MRDEINYADRHQADIEVVRRAIEGDPDAFASLFNAHKSKIYSLCLRMTSNTAEAEDLTVDRLGEFRHFGNCAPVTSGGFCEHSLLRQQIAEVV